jgi:TRAP-type C4-dicarboxylate transport system substrate-binding protein
VTLTSRKVFAASFSFLISDAKWAEISPEDQAAIRAVSGEAFAELAGGVWNAAEAGAIEKRNQSVKVLAATPEFEAELAAAGQPFIDRWLADVTAKSFDGAAALERFNAEIAALTAE